MTTPLHDHALPLPAGPAGPVLRWEAASSFQVRRHQGLLRGGSPGQGLQGVVGLGGQAPQVGSKAGWEVGLPRQMGLC